MTGSEVRLPAGLKASGKRLYSACLDAYEFDVHEELLLLQACRIADRLDILAREAAHNPPTVRNFKGDMVPHPALTESRQQSLAFARLLASLRLPSGEAGGELSRPQRRGAVRGSYRNRGLSAVPSA